MRPLSVCYGVSVIIFNVHSDLFCSVNKGTVDIDVCRWNFLIQSCRIKSAQSYSRCARVSSKIHNLLHSKCLRMQPSLIRNPVTLSVSIGAGTTCTFSSTIWEQISWSTSKLSFFQIVPWINIVLHFSWSGTSGRKLITTSRMVIAAIRSNTLSCCCWCTNC